MKRRGRVALSLMGVAILSLLGYYFVLKESDPNNGTCKAEHPYTSLCRQEDCGPTEETGTCGLDPCKEIVRYWSYAFLLAIFTGSVGGADFYLGDSDNGYKKMYLGVFSIIGLDLILVFLIITSKLIPAKHRNSKWVRRMYVLLTFVVSMLVGALIGFIIILVVIVVVDIHSLYFYNKVDVNRCPLV